MSASFIAFTGQQGLIHIAAMGRYVQWQSIDACLIININRPICTQIQIYSLKYVGAYGSECLSVLDDDDDDDDDNDDDM